jgi:hypothetical protein
MWGRSDRSQRVPCSQEVEEVGQSLAALITWIEQLVGILQGLLATLEVQIGESTPNNLYDELTSFPDGLDGSLT